VRNGTFTLRVIVPVGSDEFWEEVISAKGAVNTNLLIEAVKDMFEDHGFNDVEIDVQTMHLSAD
jgi:hypothetical protein